MQIDENKLLLILLEQSLNHKEKNDAINEVVKFIKAEKAKSDLKNAADEMNNNYPGGVIHFIDKNPSNDILPKGNV